MRTLPVLTILLLTACPAPTEPAPSAGSASPAAPQGSLTEVDIATFAERKQSGQVPLVVDVRTDGEYAAGHVPGTVHIPLDQLQARVSELERHKDQPVYLICQSGGRSARAAQLLSSKGFDAVNVKGGTGGWTAAGHPVEQ